VKGILANAEIQLENFTVHATAITRSNFAIHHLRAALRAATTAYEIEQTNTGAAHGAWFEEMMVLVPVAIVMSAAALEANTNEIIEDMLGVDGKGSQEFVLSNEQVNRLCILKLKESGATMKRYAELADILGKKPAKGKSEWQNANALVSFRNSLMHFKPNWGDKTTEKQDNWIQPLRKRILSYPPYRGRFPMEFITYSCAKWSVRTVLSFCSSFSAQIGVADRFTIKGRAYSLP
jgi:hypothetical protein